MNNSSSLKITLLLSAVAIGLLLQPTFAKEPVSPHAPFLDVNSKTDYEKSIDWMYKNGIINGYSDNNFKPDKCVNRAEMLKMLFKILQVDYEKSKMELFPDTPSSAWYAPYIRTAKERKTVKGYTDGKFHPERCVSRAEAIKMTLLEFNNGKEPPEELSDDEKYPIPKFLLNDVSHDKWYYNYITYANTINALGMKHVKPANEKSNLYNYSPEDQMSRAEVAEMLYRMKVIKDLSIDTYDEGYKPYAIILKPAEVNFELDKILLTSSNNAETGDTFEFDIYLERPDLGIKQNVTYEDPMPLTVDLNLSLQPKLMYLSEIDNINPESGSMCDRPRFPHRCSVTLAGDELNKSEHEYLIKITFEDDTYVAKTITVPHPKALEKPEIIGPLETPAQNSKFDVEFKDVGAETYDVSVNLCKPYNNDGINPCLDGTDYHFARVKNTNEFIATYEDDKSVTVKAQNGFINVKSDFPLVFEESMSYNVIATSTGKTSTNVSTIVKSSDTKFYPVE